MKTIKMVTLDCSVVSDVTLMAQAYREVFGNDPGWREGYKCPACCSTFLLSSSPVTCPDCKEPLVECWPINQIISDFNNEMAKPESICVLAKSDDKIVGFAWGYVVNVDQSLSEHFGAPDLYRLISGNFFYLDEIAVLVEYQGIGIGMRLLRNLLQKQSQPKVLLRTLDESVMCHLARKMGGEIACSISRGRIMMTFSLDR